MQFRAQRGSLIPYPSSRFLESRLLGFRAGAQAENQQRGDSDQQKHGDDGHLPDRSAFRNAQLAAGAGLQVHQDEILSAHRLIFGVAGKEEFDNNDLREPYTKSSRFHMLKAVQDNDFVNLNHELSIEYTLFESCDSPFTIPIHGALLITPFRPAASCRAHAVTDASRRVLRIPRPS